MQRGGAFYLSSQLTVFRNIDYFRKFMFALYRPSGGGEIALAWRYINDDFAYACV